jgi:hypothetical protein
MSVFSFMDDDGSTEEQETGRTSSAGRRRQRVRALLGGSAFLRSGCYAPPPCFARLCRAFVAQDTAGLGLRVAFGLVIVVVLLHDLEANPLELQTEAQPIQCCFEKNCARSPKQIRRRAGHMNQVCVPVMKTP